MALDVARSVLVWVPQVIMYGRQYPTWEWDGKAWALRKTTTAPSGRSWSAMTFAHAFVVLGKGPFDFASNAMPLTVTK